MSFRAWHIAAVIAPALVAPVPALAGDLDKHPFAADNGSSWRGPYIGAVIGGSAVGVDFAGIGKKDDADLENSALSGGVVLGYNFASGPWVWGIEADAEVMRLDKQKALTGLGTVSLEQNWQSSLRLRGGYAWDNIYVYGTAGLALSELKLQSSLGGKENLGYVSPVVGVGAELALDEDWRMRGEGLLYGFGDVDVDLAGSKREADLGHATLRLGITRKF